MAINRRTCLVTGCSEGRARAALAVAFMNAGYHVFATARTPSKIPDSLREMSNVTVLVLDVTSSESICAAAKAVHSHTGGKLDVLVNNAGHSLSMPALDTPISEAKELFDSNFFGALEMIQAFGQMLVKAKGVIVNNASMGGIQPFPFITLYNASKAAMIVAGEGWRLELAPLGVRVITLITGGITTKILENIKPVKLPEDSYYTSIKGMIEKLFENHAFGMDPDLFAASVLRRVERGSNGKYWVGGGSFLGRTAMLLFPQWALDQVALWQTPFTKILAEDHAKRIAEQKKLI